ncbi:hypothetical protein MASR2M36_09110 [Providencia sp.]
MLLWSNGLTSNPFKMNYISKDNNFSLLSKQVKCLIFLKRQYLVKNEICRLDQQDVNP